MPPRKKKVESDSESSSFDGDSSESEAEEDPSSSEQESEASVSESEASVTEQTPKATKRKASEMTADEKQEGGASSGGSASSAGGKKSAVGSSAAKKKAAAAATTTPGAAGKEEEDDASVAAVSVSSSGGSSTSSGASASKKKAAAGAAAKKKGGASVAGSSEKKKPPKKAADKAAGTAAASSSSAAAGAAAAAPAVPKAKPGDAKSIILEYLARTGRPYSAINVFDNLHKSIGKSTVQSVLDSLADAGQIRRKEFGKLKCYWAPPEDVDPAQLEAQLRELEAEAGRAKDRKAGLAARKAQLEGQVRGLADEMDDDALGAALAELKAENAARAAKLESLRALAAGTAGGGKPLLDKAQLAGLEKEFKRMRVLWLERKRLAMEAVAQVSEGANKPVKKMVDEMGIETDEEAGQAVPALE